jgi:hypothetical protein
VDYGQPVRFGVFITPVATERPLELAVQADELGFDVVGVQDHPYQRRFFDTWTLLTAIAMPSYGYVKANDLVEGNRRIDEAAAAAGRDPRSIRRVLNAGYLDASTLVSLAVDCGMDTFLVAEDEMVEFMSEIAPRVREEVESRRSRRAD